MEPRIHAGLNIRRWRPRVGPARPPKVDHVPAALEMVARGENFADREWLPSSGEMFLPPPEPAPQPQPSFTIPPPPWQAQLERGDVDPALFAPPQAQAARLTALDEIRLRDRDDEDEPAPWAPLMVTPPLQRPKVPEPDWRNES